MIGYAIYFHGNKTLSFKVIDKKPVTSYVKIWEQISSLINK